MSKNNLGDIQITWKGLFIFIILFGIFLFLFFYLGLAYFIFCVFLGIYLPIVLGQSDLSIDKRYYRLKVISVLLIIGIIYCTPKFINGIKLRRELKNISIAVKNGNIDVIKRRLEYQNLNYQDENGKNLLILACSLKESNLAKELLNHDIDINAINKFGKTALHCAIMREDVQTSELLIKKGADKTIKDKSGLSPYDYAIKSNDKRLIDLFK